MSSDDSPQPMGGLHCLNPRLFVLAKVTWNLEPRWYQKKGGMDRPQTRTERAESSVDARHCAVEVCQRSTMARSPPQGWRKDAHLAGWNYLTFPSGILPITVSQSQFCLVFTISTSLKNHQTISTGVDHKEAGGSPRGISRALSSVCHMSCE